jgi:hypothetical protein
MRAVSEGCSRSGSMWLLRLSLLRSCLQRMWCGDRRSGIECEWGLMEGCVSFTPSLLAIPQLLQPVHWKEQLQVQCSKEVMGASQWCVGVCSPVTDAYTCTFTPTFAPTSCLHAGTTTCCMSRISWSA